MLERAEVLGIIDQVLASGAELQMEPDEETAQPSARVLRRLIDAGWIEKEKRSDYREILYLEPATQTLMEALRAIINQSIASSTGKLWLFLTVEVECGHFCSHSTTSIRNILRPQILTRTPISLYLSATPGTRLNVCRS
jgi:hypothetical protein